MAAVFDFDQGAQARAGQMVDVGLTAIQTAIAPLPAKAAVAEIARARRFLSGLETQVLATAVTAAGDARGAERLAGDGKTSRRESRRRAKRAKANAASGGKLGDRLASGALSEEQADLIADASDASDGAAANDAEFIDKIAGVDPDQGKAIRDDWLAARKTKDGVQTEHERQRALRRMQTYVSKRHGLGVVAVEGDCVAQNLMRDAIKQRADEIYRRDGGRDVPANEHPRTRAQREFDAAFELLCGVTTRADGTSHTAPPSPATTDGVASSMAGAPVVGDDAGSAKVAPATGDDAGPMNVEPEPAPDRDDPSNDAQSEPSRPRIVIGFTVDGLIGRDPAAMATQIGLGLIPDSVLADYAEHADIFAALFDRKGEQLWQGRLCRYATAAQYIALVIRDRGCVLCGASHTECDAHHNTPWNAPARGESNLDTMALLCKRCHNRLHAENHTLYRCKRTRRWMTRPATGEETPPKRLPRPGRGDRPQRE